jgi:hypothetical protein
VTQSYAGCAAPDRDAGEETGTNRAGIGDLGEPRGFGRKASAEPQDS